MILKHLFYEEHGVQEYYIYDPDQDTLVVYLREGDLLRPRRIRTTFVSPLLKIRFDLTGDEMAVFYPDGRRFLAFEELEAARSLAEKQADETNRLFRRARVRSKGPARPGQRRGVAGTGATRKR